MVLCLSVATREGEWGDCLVVAGGLLITMACLAQQHGLQGAGASAASAQELQFLGSRAQAQWLWHTGLVSLIHVGSSRTRD